MNRKDNEIDNKLSDEDIFNLQNSNLIEGHDLIKLFNRLSVTIERDIIELLFRKSLFLKFEDTILSGDNLQERIEKLTEFLTTKDYLSSIGLMVRNPIYGIIATVVCHELGRVCYIFNSNSNYKKLEDDLKGANIDLIIYDNYTIDRADKLFWNSNTLKECIYMYEIMNQKSHKVEGYKAIWNMIAQESTEDIYDYGWNNCYNGEPFSKQEMDDYIDNIKSNILPIIDRNKSIFEIGCGKGLVMMSLLPYVGKYYGCDISEIAISKLASYQMVQENNNVDLFVSSADNIGNLNVQIVDLVLCSSVVQYFPNTVYLESVINSAIHMLGDKGVIYIEDLLDADKKTLLINSIHEYKEKYPTARSKLSWENDLFINRQFFEYLESKYDEISEIKILEKKGNIHNELHDYRYGVMIFVNQLEKKNRKNCVKYINYQEDIILDRA